MPKTFMKRHHSQFKRNDDVMAQQLQQLRQLQQLLKNDFAQVYFFAQLLSLSSVKANPD